MSSKLEIEKICEWCGNRFIAKKTTTNIALMSVIQKPINRLKELIKLRM